jgi:carboxymethylenebutenolidase
MAVNTEMIEFSGTGGDSAQGLLVTLAIPGVSPGLILIQEWWGLNDHIKDVARRFAEEGYVVLVPDLYAGKVTKDPDEAGRLMQGLDKEAAIRILIAAVDYLQSHSAVAGERIGVTGFCMGGSFALLLACRDFRVKATVPFYGDVPADQELENLSAPVLFIGAENDFWITQDKISRLQDGLTRFGKEGEIKVYSDVGHAFFNDTRPDAYDQVAADDAWRIVLQFLARYV